MPNTPEHNELLAKLLDGSLKPDEWARARTLWGEAQLRDMLSGEQRLRELYQATENSAASQDLTSAIMNRVALAPAPNRALFWILKYGGLLGTAIFLLGLSTVMIAFSGSSPVSFTFTAPDIDGTIALWGIPVMILIGVGIWRMETA